MYLEVISPKMEIKVLNSIFDSQSFLVSCVVVKLCWLELSTGLSAIKLLSFNFFYEDCSPVLVTSICL